METKVILQKILDGITIVAFLIVGRIWANTSVGYLITAFLLSIVAIHATYALTSIKRSKLSKITWIAISAWPILAFILIKIALGVISFRYEEDIDYFLIIPLGIALVVETIILLVHLCSFIRDCIIARKKAN